MKTLLTSVAIVGTAISLYGANSNAQLAFDNARVAFDNTSTELAFGNLIDNDKEREFFKTGNKTVPSYDVNTDFEKAVKQYPFVDKKGGFDRENWHKFVDYCKSQPDIGYGKELLQKGKEMKRAVRESHEDSFDGPRYGRK